MDCLEAKTVPSLLNQHKIISMTCIFGGCPGVPVHGGIPIVFISIHGVLTQFIDEHFKLWLGCKFRTWFASISSFVDSFT